MKNIFKKYVIYVLLVVGIVASVVLSICFTYKNASDEVVSTVTYMIQGNSNYKVYYNENPYFQDEYYDSNTKAFASNYIKRIDIDFDYHVNYSDVVDGSVSYYVEAVLTDSVLDKSYILEKQVKETYKSKSEDLLVSVPIDYEYYTNLYRNYMNDVGESNVGNAKIDVYFRIVNSANYQSMDEMSKDNYLLVSIPINYDNYIEINRSDDISDEENTVTIKNNNKNMNLFYNIASITMWIIAVLLIFTFGMKYNRDMEGSSGYKRKLAKILRDFDDIIVNVKRLPHMDSYEVIEVTTFNELRDAQSEVDMPINFKEDKHQAKFVLIKDNIAWIYTLKDNKKE